MSFREEEKTVLGLLTFLLRTLRHWSQADMSAASGIHKSQLSLYELGRILASDPNLRRIAVAAGIPWVEAHKALLALHAWHRLMTGEPGRRLPVPFASRMSTRIGQSTAGIFRETVHPFLVRRLPAFADPGPTGPPPAPEPGATGLLISLLRAFRRWTKEDLARASGIPRSQLSAYELNLVSPRRRTLERIAASMAVDLDDALEALPFLRDLVRAAHGLRTTHPPDNIARFGEAYFRVAVAWPASA